MSKYFRKLYKSFPAFLFVVVVVVFLRTASLKVFMGEGRLLFCGGGGTSIMGGSIFLQELCPPQKP